MSLQIQGVKLVPLKSRCCPGAALWWWDCTVKVPDVIKNECGIARRNEKLMRYLTSLAIAIMVCIMVTPAHATLQVNIGGTVSGGTVTGGALFTDNCTVVGPNCTSVDLLPGTTGSLSFVYSGLGTFTISTLNATSHSPTAILSMTINGDVAADTTFTVAITDTGFSIPAPPIMLAQDVHGT